jgi:hypothetical protein
VLYDIYIYIYIYVIRRQRVKEGNWPVRQSELTNRYLNQFIGYIKSMDFVKINHTNDQM